MEYQLIILIVVLGMAVYVVLEHYEIKRSRLKEKQIEEIRRKAFLECIDLIQALKLNERNETTRKI